MNYRLPVKDWLIIHSALAGLLLAIAILFAIVKAYEAGKRIKSCW
jgi:hypothetical protein